MNWGSSLALWAIKCYRRHLSPLKGYRCASGQAGAAHTCSAMGMRIFKKAGPLQGLALLRRQFDRCAIAAEALGRSREALAQSVRARASNGAMGSQGGFVDCGGCDAPGCDAPSCDLPDCGAKCVPDCGDLTPKSCQSEAPLRDCSPNWLGGGGNCGGNSVCQGFGCCDGLGWDGKSAKAKARVESRKERRQKRRERAAGKGGVAISTSKDLGAMGKGEGGGKNETF